MNTQSPNHQITKSPNSPTCLVLYSGGLDSILACRILQDQGIRVIGLHMITPFFGYELKGRERAFKDKAFSDYGIEIKIIDISEQYLKMVKKPEHGYGRYMNPCIDCKILMVREAVHRLGEFNASFVATGDVLGQRPMSQRRDTLRIIERDSNAEGLLLRPLSAAHFPSGDIEKRGLVDRSRLPGLSGRGRKEQIALAERYGISHYPAPAGGCVLADPIMSRRLKHIFRIWPDLNINDCLLAQAGRHFLLPDGSWLIIGRRKGENARIESMTTEGDIHLNLVAYPGPMGLLRRTGSDPLAGLAAGILCRYSKAKGPRLGVRLSGPGTGEERIVHAGPVSDEIIEKLRM